MANNKKQNQSGFTRPSFLFVFLVIIVCGIFAAAMFHLASLPTPEEKRQADIARLQSMYDAESAAKLGISVEEYTAIQTRKRERQTYESQLILDLQFAIKELNDQKLNVVLLKLQGMDIAAKAPGLLAGIVKADYPFAFARLLKQSVACDTQSNSGRQAFDAAINSPSSIFLELLLKNNCFHKANIYTDSLEQRLAKSDYPERLFMLSKTEALKSFQDEVFMRLIKSGSEKRATQMLEHGANPNAVAEKSGESAFLLSLRYNMPQLSMKLIAKGADFTAKTSEKGSLLSIAIANGYLELAREMLKRDSELIIREKLGESILSAALSVRNNEQRQEAWKFVLSNGVEIKQLKDRGAGWLIRVIRMQDPVLVKEVLEQGVDVNRYTNYQTALGIAQSYKGDNSQEIVKLLEEYGATDGFFGLLRNKT